MALRMVHPLADSSAASSGPMEAGSERPPPRHDGTTSRGWGLRRRAWPAGGRRVAMEPAGSAASRLGTGSAPSRSPSKRMRS
jgi:hypothetical protein